MRPFPANCVRSFRVLQSLMSFERGQTKILAVKHSGHSATQQNTKREAERKINDMLRSLNFNQLQLEDDLLSAASDDEPLLGSSRAFSELIEPGSNASSSHGARACQRPVSGRAPYSQKDRPPLLSKAASRASLLNGICILICRQATENDEGSGRLFEVRDC